MLLKAVTGGTSIRKHRIRSLVLFATTALVVVSGFVGVKMDTSVPGWFEVSKAEASPYRRSVRRTARRTSRRTAYRNNHYYGAPAYGAPVVVGTTVVTTIPVGTVVATLPPSCSTMLVRNINYYYCSGYFYVQSGDQWTVVAPPK